MEHGCGDAASCEGAMVVAGALPQSHFALAVGRGWARGRVVAAPKSSAWLFPVELVKALLNELASVKVNEVSKLGKGAGGGSSGVSSRTGAEKPPVPLRRGLGRPPPPLWALPSADLDANHSSAIYWQ